jgi:hypothetical protein
MIDLPSTSQKHPTVKVGDIVIFGETSCAWAHHCGLLEESHGLGSLGLVMESCSQEQRLSVFLFYFHKSLSPWNNCLEYGDDSGATLDDAAQDIYAVLPADNYTMHRRVRFAWISENQIHQLFQIYFIKMMRRAQEELAIPDDIMREIRGDTNDFDLGGWADYISTHDITSGERSLGEVLEYLDEIFDAGVAWVTSCTETWLEEKADEPHLNPEHLLDIIEEMQQDRSFRHKGADRLLKIWGRGGKPISFQDSEAASASGVIRQGFAGVSRAEAFNGSQK